MVNYTRGMPNQRQNWPKGQKMQIG